MSVEVGHAKVDASVQVPTGVHPDVKLELSAPVPVSINACKALIVSKIEKKR